MALYTINIKNDSGSIQTWVGKAFAIDEEYTIEDRQKQSWANDSGLIDAIMASDALVGDGNLYFSDANEGLNYLKGVVTSKVKQAAIIDPDGKRARLVGAAYGSVPVGTTKDFDYLMEQLTYGGSNKNSIFNGVQYYAKNAEVGDSITFQVVDKDGTGVTLGLYPQAYYDAYKDGNGVLVIEEFGDSWYVAPNTMEDIILYESTIYPGLYLRSSYTSTGTGSDPEFMLNLYRHLVE